MKIAFFTPWPPNYSGIAEYVFGIVEGLSHFHEILVVHEKDSDEGIVTLPNVTFSSWKDPNIKMSLKNINLFVFQFGNNFECHGFILNFLNYSVPKILHLHDLALCHFYGELAHNSQPPYNFKEILFPRYGRNSLVEYDFISKTTDPLLTGFSVKYPLLHDLLKHSDSIIVHSIFAKNKIREHLYLKDVFKITQLYNLTSGRDLDPQHYVRIPRKFGVFGHVDPQKKVHLIIRLFSKLLKEGLDVELHIYGKLNKQYAESCAEEFAGSEFLNRGIYIHGFQAQSDLNRNLAQVDSVIALRSPTMGETSAIVMKSLQFNRITVVSNVGWYSELPHFVIKISNDNIEKELEARIRELIKIGFSEGESQEKFLDFNKMIEEYSDIVSKVKENYSLNSCKEMENRVRAIMEECFLMNDSFINNELEETFNKLIREIS